MELSPSWEVATRSATQDYFNFMERQGSLPCSQRPSTGPYQFSPLRSIYVYVFLLDSLLLFPQKHCMHSPSRPQARYMLFPSPRLDAS
jgi:hypothetical protein